MELRKIAAKYIGKTRAELGLKCEETCAEFVSKILREAGYKESSISCNELFKQMKANPEQWDEPETQMQANDVIYFEWDGTMSDNLPLDHVGVIDEVRGDTVYYININGNDHDKVTRQSMSVHSSNIAYWLRPITESNNTSKLVPVRLTIGGEVVYDGFVDLEKLGND